MGKVIEGRLFSGKVSKNQTIRLCGDIIHADKFRRLFLGSWFPFSWLFPFGWLYRLGLVRRFRSIEELSSLLTRYCDRVRNNQEAYAIIRRISDNEICYREKKDGTRKCFILKKEVGENGRYFLKFITHHRPNLDY